LFLLTSPLAIAIPPNGAWHGLPSAIAHVAATFLSGASGASPCNAVYLVLILLRYSILPAISLDGVLHLDIITRSWTGTEFFNYINNLLDNMNPFPMKNSVIVMDNASIHHCDGLREMVEAR
jgi:hypothetical protein